MVAAAAAVTFSSSSSAAAAAASPAIHSLAAFSHHAICLSEKNQKLSGCPTGLKNKRPAARDSKKDAVLDENKSVFGNNLSHTFGDKLMGRTGVRSAPRERLLSNIILLSNLHVYITVLSDISRSTLLQF